MMKLPFYGSNIGEDVGMIEFQVVQDRSFWPVMNELGALIEERGVVLIGLDDKKGRVRKSR